jgi:hypothetical protein
MVEDYNTAAIIAARGDGGSWFHRIDFPVTKMPVESELISRTLVIGDVPALLWLWQVRKRLAHR